MRLRLQLFDGDGAEVGGYEVVLDLAHPLAWADDEDRRKALHSAAVAAHLALMRDQLR